MKNILKSSTFKILALAAIITAGLWTFYFYQLKQITKTTDSFGELNKKIIFAAKKEVAVKQLREKIVTTSNNGLDLQAFIIKGDEATQLVQQLESFGPQTKTTITINSVSTEPSPSLPPGAEILRLDLSIKGSKTNVLNSVQLIESLPYNMKIKDFNLSRSTDSTAGTSTSVAILWQYKIDLQMVKLAEDTKGSAKSN
jgi:Tfp pilus assembly protein PilO